METKISKSSIVSVATEQVSCNLAGEAAILDLKSGEYYGLNGVGARIWNLIQQPKSVTEVLSVLLDEYDADPEQCERDLRALLDELKMKGLIEVKDGTPT